MNYHLHFLTMNFDLYKYHENQNVSLFFLNNKNFESSSNLELDNKVTMFVENIQNNFDYPIINDDNYITLIEIVNTLKTFCNLKIDLDVFPKQLFSYLFDLSLMSFGNSMNKNQYILSLAKLFIEFLNYSDNQLILIANNGFMKCLIDLLVGAKSINVIIIILYCIKTIIENCPLTSQFIQAINLYKNVYNIYYSFSFSSTSKKEFLFDNTSEHEETNFLIFLTAEVIFDIFIFLPEKYREIWEKNPNLGPMHFVSIGKHLFELIKSEKGDDFVNHMKILTQLFWKVFHYTDPSIKKYFKNKEMIDLFIDILLNYPSNNDILILECLQQIADSGATPAKQILSEKFLKYDPFLNNTNQINTKLVCTYCYTWETIISSLGGQTPLIFARKQGIQYLKAKSNKIFELIKLLLSLDQMSFEIMKSTTLILIGMINTNDNELISEIINMNLDPNICERIQCIIEENDPKTLYKILQSIDILLEYINSKVDNKTMDIKDWLKSDELINMLNQSYETVENDNQITIFFTNLLEKIK